jgi:hypothetical protein
MNATRRRTSRRTGKPAVTRERAVAPGIVRLSRVRTALQRIESGYYDREDVRTRLANVVLKELQKN